MAARMFTAVVPPPAAVEALNEFLAPRLDADRDLRWTRDDAWHLTTAFMAEVAARSVEPLLENLRAVGDRTPAFDLELAGAGCFPNPYEAKVLWLGLRRGADAAARLASRCRTAGERAGVAVDGARFVPHVTVARTRRRIEATRWLRVLDAFEGTAWRATDVALVESHLRERQNRYEVVERFPLRG